MAAADKEKVVATVRQRLALDADQAAELADRAEEIFLTETGRLQVPDRAFWLWVDLALAVHKGDTGIGEQQVTSIKRGDTTIQYSSSSAAALPAGSVLSRVQQWRVARTK